MTAYVTGLAMHTCHGGAEETWTALLEGRCGVRELMHVAHPDRLGIGHGYPIGTAGADEPGEPGRWLATVVAEAVAQTNLPAGARVSVVVGTGLRELRSVELAHRRGEELQAQDLHFRKAVTTVLPQAQEVITISNACSASGTAVALGMDLLDAGEADVVIAAGCDSMTESMLTVIGRVGAEPSECVQPFQEGRKGVLLGEGAAAIVLSRHPEGARAVVRSVGLSCDAFHETAPDRDGIVAAMKEAHDRAGTDPGDVRLVIAHGTGTALNDPVEAEALSAVVGNGPLVTALKGSIGHTSGGASLMNMIVAVFALERGVVPPVVGLSSPIAEAADLRLVIGAATPTGHGLAQIDAFGFGGVNAVTLVEV